MSVAFGTGGNIVSNVSWIASDDLPLADGDRELGELNELDVACETVGTRGSLVFYA